MEDSYAAQNNFLEDPTVEIQICEEMVCGESEYFPASHLEGTPEWRCRERVSRGMLHLARKAAPELDHVICQRIAKVAVDIKVEAEFNSKVGKKAFFVVLRRGHDSVAFCL